MNTLSKRSLLTRIRERIQYGLVTQEIVDSLMSRFGIMITPYFIVSEKLRADFTPSDDGADSFEIRFLDDTDLESLTDVRTRPRSLEKLKNTLTYSECLGIFVNGRLAGYTWSRFDQIPVPICMRPLVLLEGDEAYLFDAFVSRDYRGLRLAPIVRQQLYRELAEMGRTHLYSITLAFNRSSRRFKAKLGAQETEMRLLLGILGWRAIDLRLKAFKIGIRTPKFQWLNLKTKLANDS